MSDSDQLKDIVIYFSDGVMSGVFGLGVAQAVLNAGLEKRVSTTYGNSSGALTALSVPSRQAEFFARMYWEDLSGSRYLRLWRLPAYICAAYCNRFFGTTFSLRPIFDIEYLENVILSSKKVDYHTLFESHITVHIISHNLERDLNEYLTIASENDVRPMLRATGSGHPAYPRPEKVHGSLYIDGAARTDACEIEDILRRHPTEQVILVINEHGWREKSLRNILEKWATAILALPQYGWRQAWKIGCSGFTKVDRARIERTHPNVSIIENDLSISKWSTDAQQYKELYARGLALGAELIDKKWGPSSA